MLAQQSLKANGIKLSMDVYVKNGKRCILQGEALACEYTGFTPCLEGLGCGCDGLVELLDGCVGDTREQRLCRLWLVSDSHSG